MTSEIHILANTEELASTAAEAFISTTLNTPCVPKARLPSLSRAA
jgi:hypothetical protein